MQHQQSCFCKQVGYGHLWKDFGQEVERSSYRLLYMYLLEYSIDERFIINIDGSSMNCMTFLPHYDFLKQDGES